MLCYGVKYRELVVLKDILVVMYVIDRFGFVLFLEI